VSPATASTPSGGAAWWRRLIWPVALVLLAVAGQSLARLGENALPVAAVNTAHAISLAAIITLMLHVGYALLVTLLSGPWPVLGVAQAVVREAVRMKLIVAFMAVLIIILAALPFILSAEQPLRFQIQQFLSWSLRATMFLLSLLTVFLACGTLATEVEQKQIFTTMTKPIGRGKYLLGKWLGIALLDALLLVVAGTAIYLVTVFYLAQLPPRDGFDRIAIQEQVLTARVDRAPALPENFDQLLQQELTRRRQAAADNPNFEGVTPRGLEEQVREDLTTAWRSLAPRGRGQWRRTYTFDNLTRAKVDNELLQLAYKVNTARPVPGQKTRLGFAVNQRALPPTEAVVDQTQHLEIPAAAIDDQGRLHITVFNLNDNVSISLPGEDGLQLLYTVGGFTPNFAKGLSMNWMKLIFLAALGLTCASFLSLPVAVLTALLVYFAASASDYILEAVQQRAGADVAVPGVDLVLDLMARGFTMPLQAFAQYNPADPLANGQYITWSAVGLCALWIGLCWTAAAGAVGWLIFSRRELARVQV